LNTSEILTDDHLENRKPNTDTEIDDDVPPPLGCSLGRNRGAGGDVIQTAVDTERSRRNTNADSNNETGRYINQVVELRDSTEMREMDLQMSHQIGA
jgi:hypothetical protein